MSGQQEVEKFLKEIGLESCVQAVVHNGFYTSMEALSGANYEELVDSGVRPVHAKLILSNLGSKSGLSAGALGVPGGGASSADEVNHFLRSVGLENCAPQLTEAGFTSLASLSEASMQDLTAIGLKTVHARLIVSNLDTASTAGIAMTPAAARLASIEADDTLLGGPKKKPRGKLRLICFGLLVLLAVAFGVRALSGGAAAAPPPALGGGGSAESTDDAPAPPKVHKGGKGSGEGKVHKAAGEGGKGEGHKGGGKSKPTA